MRRFGVVLSCLGVEMNVIVVLGRAVVRGRLDIGQADAVSAEVELSVEAADEDVTENPQRSGRRRNVHPQEAAQANRLTHFRHLHKQSTSAMQTR